MKTAEQIAEKLWEKHMADRHDDGQIANKADFLAAILAFKEEYGEAVRQKAAGVCGRLADSQCYNIDERTVAKCCAAAIERMELP